MNKNNAKDYLPLVQALAEGRVIQESWTTLREAWRDYDGRGADGSVTPLDSIPLRHLRIKHELRKAWVWWPALPNHAEFYVRLYLEKKAAEQAVRIDGGHITEVTE